jgi:MFS transporter, PAT family, solute carrier family 33 (acetyl-CoA transportor), member 1
MTATLPSPSIRGEEANLALLFFLYFLQGLPMGLSVSVPLFLASRGASFTDQALFSLSSWPYSLKVLWAPLVDALWTEKYRLGQRKSWVIPVQIITGFSMIALGTYVAEMLGSDELSAAKLDIKALTAVFFLLYFLVATQDIAVDGWALTMLRPENVGFASSANMIGQSIGVTTAYSLFLALDNPSVCDRYIRKPLGLKEDPHHGLVTMAGFMSFWGLVFIVSTLVVWALKVEATHASIHNDNVDEKSVLTDENSLEKDQESNLSPKTHSSRGRKATTSSVADTLQISTSAETNGLSNGSVRKRSNGSESRCSTASSTDEKNKNSIKNAGAEDEEEDNENLVLLNSSTQVTSPSSNEVIQKEKASSLAAESVLTSVWVTYAKSITLLSLPSVVGLVVIMVTIKAGFQTTDRSTNLVLQGRGIPKEALAMLDMLSFPVQMIFQFSLAKASAGPQALSQFVLGTFPYRAAFGLVWLLVVYVALPDNTLNPWAPGDVPWPYLALIFAVSNVHGALQSVMFMGQMSFFNTVSSTNPRLGGTLMTLLNTAANFGSMWCTPIALASIDFFTVNSCTYSAKVAESKGLPVWDAIVQETAEKEVCVGAESAGRCAALGGVCFTKQSGFIISSLLSVGYCIVWYFLMKQRVLQVQNYGKEAWKI